MFSISRENPIQFSEDHAGLVPGFQNPITSIQQPPAYGLGSWDAGKL
jgi:hypothetical protein